MRIIIVIFVILLGVRRGISESPETLDRAYLERLKLYCKSCLKDFNKDPKKYIKKIDEGAKKDPKK